MSNTNADTTSPGRDLRRVRIFLLWGQSHMAGAGNPREPIQQRPAWSGRNYPAIKDCYIFDKYKRGNPLNDERFMLHATDQTMGHIGERFALRPLTAGFAETSDYPFYRDNYPWEGFWSPPIGAEVGDLHFGPEMSFAEKVQKRTGDIVVILKLVKGGSQVFGFNDIPNWNASMAPATGGPSLLKVLLDVYWDLGKAEAIRRFGPSNGSAMGVRLGGVLSFIGTSDSRPQYIGTYAENMRASIEAVQEHIRSSPAPGPDAIPWLIVGSPNLGAPNTVPSITAVQQIQGNLAESMLGVDFLDSDPILRFGPSETHAGTQGNFDIGEAMADWALDQRPFAL